MSKGYPQTIRKLDDVECRYYRDQLREARYAALADSEGFDKICFALEALGLRLLGREGDLGKYEDPIGFYARLSPVLKELAKSRPSEFKSFEDLYKTVRNARNDNMHVGAYARHATGAAIELSIGLEEALMINVERTISSLMVKSPITVEPWQPVAHARQLMLMHSFSCLPIRHENQWWLLSELSLARFLNVSRTKRKILLGLSIEDANKHQPKLLALIDDKRLCTAETNIDKLLEMADTPDGMTLWLVIDNNRKDHLVGVLSPFELI
jgi:CBS domain-containing protein